jgi:UDP-2,3-diacylglucosamine pyrophosphatase LpxH
VTITTTETPPRAPSSLPSRAAARDDGFDHLLLSDIHLGSDIVPHVRPWARSSWLLRAAEVDVRLITLFDHYREHCAEGRRWRMIIAGDFLDLVGVSLPTGGPSLCTEPNADEHMHGLGSSADHVVEKTRAIAARHPQVFRSLMQFLAAGHTLVVVRGNHDIELHWREAQDALIEAIVEHAPEADRPRLAARIQICPWFFAIDGLLYVEHGHEFDAMCSYGDPLQPTCLRDPRRIRSTPFSVLLRQVARPTRGLSSSSYGYVGMGAYVTLLQNLGFSGSAQIAVRYSRASYRLVGECFARAVGGRLPRMDKARSLLSSFAQQTGVSVEQLETLRSLYVAPAVESLNLVVRSLYLDRVAALLLAGGVLATAIFVAQHASVVAGGLCAIPGLAFGGYAWVGRGSNTSPQASMHQGAVRIAELFRARWVVMGHTHEPLISKVAEGSEYVNLGSWGTDDPPDEQTGAHTSSCTYLVIRKVGGEHTAELLRWDVERGPQPTDLSVAPTN